MPLSIHSYYITKNVAKWLLDNFGICNTSIDVHIRNLYYSQIPKDWKCALWWEGIDRDPEIHNQTCKNVLFNGLTGQNHNL